MTAADYANRLRESLANASQAFDVDGRQVLASEMQWNIQDVDALEAQAAERDAYARQSEEQAVEAGKWRHRAEAAEARVTELETEFVRLREGLRRLAYDLCIYPDARAALDPEHTQCVHEWVDATNEAVESGEVCLKCGAIRAATEHTQDEA